MNPTSRWRRAAPQRNRNACRGKAPQEIGRPGRVTECTSKRGRAADSADGAPASRRVRAVLHNAYGNTYFGMQNWDQARAYFEKASALMPESAVPVYNLHRLYARIGDKEKAETAPAMRHVSMPALS